MSFHISNHVVSGFSPSPPILKLKPVKGFVFAGQAKSENASILYFHSSKKFILNGAKESETIKKMLKALFPGENSIEYKIVNISGVYHHSAKLNLEKLYDQMIDDGYFIIYDQEVFPALVWKQNCKSSGTINIFYTGKMCVTGFRKLEDINLALDKVLLCYSQKSMETTKNF